MLIAVAVAAAVVTPSAGAPGFDGPGAALRPGAVPVPYGALILAVGRQCPAVPARVLAAQLEAESGFDAAAVSPAGAQGIAQFMPATWRRWGRDEDRDGTADPFDPADAIPAQARYDCALAEQLRPAVDSDRLAGDLTDLMLAAYNAGPGAVLAAGGIPQNGETPGYVERIRARTATFAAALTGTEDQLGVPATGGGLGAAVVAAAAVWVDRAPYVWGGGGPEGPTGGATPGVGFDCSGLVLHALYRASGGRILLPHLADAQARLAPTVTPADLRPGDVIAFADPDVSTFHHIGIYVGGGRLLHAPDFGQTVEVTSLDSPYWSGQRWRAERFS